MAIILTLFVGIPLIYALVDWLIPSDKPKQSK